MINICVSGAAGRMGKSLIQAAHIAEFTTLSAALEYLGNDAIGTDAGILAGIDSNGVIVGTELGECQFEIIIEFTTPQATLSHLDYCVKHGKNIVIGTTGFTNQQVEQIRDASTKVGIVYAPNMSVGVNVCLSLVQQAARAFGDTVDIEVIEAHHSRKVDAPSGTALKLGEVVAEELGRTLDDNGVFVRHGVTGARERKSIGFATIRAGDIVGEHTVMFAGEGERVEITHRSNSRMNYAMGAMMAAQWIVEKESGLYDMQDVLGLS